MQTSINSIIACARNSLIVSNNGLSFLKWFAVIAMIADHINKYGFDYAYPPLYHFGRLAMPIFLFVLVFNLSRNDFFDTGKHKTLIKRLLVFALLSSPAYILLKIGIIYTIFPLNIMFSLAVVVGIIYFFDRKHYFSSFVLFFLSGFFIEYFWCPGLIALGVWLFLKKQTLPALFPLTAGFGLLLAINQNLTALLAIVLIMAASRVHFNIPRCKWFFYWFYPAHLTALWLITS